ncbi:hypothetical protein HDU99_008818, partial [Rhizoclosmatium hyalinum]
MSSLWGGHEIDHTRQLYPFQSVDGSVHAEAGPQLQKYLDSLPKAIENVKCPTGSAVVTPSFGLEKRFSVLVHTAVPFREDVHSEISLRDCYISSIDAVRAKFPTDALKIATVLIGSGSRAFENHTCINAALEVYRILLEAKR